MIRTVRLLVSSIAGFLAVVFFFFCLQLSTWWSLAIVVFFWIAFLIAVHLYLDRLIPHRTRTIAITVSGTIAILSLLILTEWDAQKYALILAGGVLTSMLFFVSIPLGDTAPFIQNRVRRLIKMCWVFTVYAYATTLFAVSIFFQNAVPFFVIALILGALYAIGAAVIWRLYGMARSRSATVWRIILGIAMSEIGFAIHLLPFGYFASGALATWIWYVAELLIRFHATPQGILWKEQRWFLAGNLALFIMVLLFFVRWI